MRGMLLGFFSPIIDKVSGWITDALNKALGWLIQNVIGPLLSIVVSLTMYWLSLYFYQISIFLLALVDFVEAVFRALVGLPAKANGFKLQFTNGNGATPEDVDGDILVQLIRSETVQSTFVSMVIVGLFLLVVTSVFQIIKTEYTTEGAKNAKGPILQKALKGLGNLILLPALVVLGIVFSNHLLILLDTATGNSEGSMSSQIFVAASQKAIYQPSDFCIHMSTSIPDLAIIDLMMYTIPISLDAWNNSAPDWGKFDDDVSLNIGPIKTFDKTEWVQGTTFIKDGKTNVDAVEELFTSGSDNSLKYFLMNDVSKYYNYSRINYLLLILGSCIAIKCLYYTCFGLVVRLWKCLMLFIISPVIVGMTPINEGGLGKWRGQFIGQVLSGYGTVLALNLFFILINVMLSIDIVAVSPNTIIGSLDGLSDGLFKMIIVISGCLMIEKFAKELGGWFGAEDAMGAGKDMSKQVGDIAMQGVAVAATVAGAAATGGASLVASAGSLAGKLGAGGKAAAQAEKEADFMGLTGDAKKDYVKNARKEARQNAWFGGPLKEGEESKNARANIAENSGHIDKAIANISKYSAENATIDVANAKLNKQLASLPDNPQNAAERARINEQIKDNNKRKAHNEKLIATNNENINDWQSKNRELSGNVKKGLVGRTKENIGNKVHDAVMKGDIVMQSYVAGAKDEVKGMMPWAKRVEKLDKTARAGAKKLGPHHQAVFEGMDKDKEKAVQDQAAATPAAQYFAAKAASVASDRMIEEMGLLRENALKQGQKLIDDLNKYISRINSSSLTDEEKSAKIFDAKEAYAEKFKDIGAKVDVSGVDQLLNGTLKLDASTLHLDFNPESIKKAVKEAMDKGHSMDAIREALINEFKKMGAEGNANLIKQIEGIITKVMNDMGGGK